MTDPIDEVGEVVATALPCCGGRRAISFFLQYETSGGTCIEWQLDLSADAKRLDGMQTLV